MVQQVRRQVWKYRRAIDCVSSCFNQLIQGKPSTAEGSRPAPAPACRARRRADGPWGDEELRQAVRSCRREGQPLLLRKALLPALVVAQWGPPSPEEWYRPALGISQTTVMLCQSDSPPEPPKNVIPKAPAPRFRNTARQMGPDPQPNRPALSPPLPPLRGVS